MGRFVKASHRFFKGAFSLVGRRVIDRTYRNRHPGRIERAFIRLAAPAVRLMYPNDRWSLPVHAPYWMEAVNAPAVEPLPISRRIFTFTAYRGAISNQLALAALLAWRGHRITLGYLPKLRSPVKEPLEDHPSAASYLRAAFARVNAASGGRVNVVDLSQYIDLTAPYDEDRVERQAMVDAIMSAKRESLDPNDPADKKRLEYYRDLGVRAQRSVWGYLASRRSDFDLAIIPNAATFETAHVCSVIRRLDLPFVSLEKSTFRNDRAMCHGDDIFSATDVGAAWVRRDELGYTEPRFHSFAVAHSTRLMNERRAGSTENWQYSLQRAPAHDALVAVSDAGIDATRPFVLVCTNVPYDAGYESLTQIFPTMRVWLVDTVRFLLDHTNLQIVVRAHPGEADYFGSHEKSETNLMKAGLLPGPRLVTIPGAAPTNTYGLMERCKFGIVFSSTVGYEMAMLGKKVILGSNIYYGRRGFTVDVVDRADYFAKLGALAAEQGMLSISSEQRQDAALYHFMYHYVQQWPYPWHKAGAHRELPPDKLVRSELIRRYLPTLDALATPPAEFNARLGDFLSVNRCLHLPRPQDVDKKTVSRTSALAVSG